MNKSGTPPAAPGKESQPAAEPHVALPKGGAGGLLGGRLGLRYMVAAAAYPPDVKGVDGIGQRMLWGRERRQLSSRAIAAEIDLSPEAITYYERDSSKRSMAADKADKIAKMLGLNFDWFCRGIGLPFVDMAAGMSEIRATREKCGLPIEMQGSPGVDLQLIKMTMGTGNMASPTTERKAGIGTIERRAGALDKKLRAMSGTKKRKPA